MKNIQELPPPSRIPVLKAKKSRSERWSEYYSSALAGGATVEQAYVSADIGLRFYDIMSKGEYGR